MEAKETKIVVHGREYPLVTEPEFTLGEAAEAERITGQTYDWEQGGALGLLAMLLVSVRRVDATVKLEDLEILKGDELDVVVPKKADGDAVVPPSTNVEPNENDDSTNRSSELASEDFPEPTPALSGTEA